MPSNRKRKNKDPKENPIRNYARYSGIVFQMVAVILVFYFAGNKIDQLFENEKPIATLIALLLGVVIAMVLTIRSLNKK